MTVPYWRGDKGINYDVCMGAPGLNDLPSLQRLDSTGHILIPRHPHENTVTVSYSRALKLDEMKSCVDISRRSPWSAHPCPTNMVVEVRDAIWWICCQCCQCCQWSCNCGRSSTIPSSLPSPSSQNYDGPIFEGWIDQLDREKVSCKDVPGVEDRLPCLSS